VIKSRLADGLLRLGFNILGPVTGPNASGIITIWDSKRNMQALFERLTSEQIICSARQDRLGRQYIRFSPHFYNTEPDVERVLDVIARSY
jgi:cysteine desulfurase / selenocysteine lyase